MSEIPPPALPTAEEVMGAIRSMTIEQFADAIRQGTDELLAEKLPEIEAAVRADERVRIAVLAEDRMASYPDNDGFALPFADLIREPASWVPDTDKVALLRERDDLREQLATVRDRLENLAAGMELSASAARSSRKSEIEQGCAEAVRGIAVSITGAGNG